MSESEDLRKKFLIELYNQLWNSINTRLNLTWESIGILVSAFAVFALTQKNVISLSIAAAIMLLVATWYLAHTIDMSFWYNRNRAMISNIEREFLNISDVTLLFPYFISHRKNNKMVYYHRIQAYLGIGLALIILFIDISQDVLPILDGEASPKPETYLPFLILIIGIIYLFRFKVSRDQEYLEFIKKSPGRDLRAEAKISALGPTSSTTLQDIDESPKE
jgi:hypothetical protein